MIKVGLNCPAFTERKAMTDKKKEDVAIEETKKEPEKVVLSKASFNKKGKHSQREADVEVPELNELMGLKKGQIAIIRVKQMDLNVFLSSRNEITNEVSNLVAGIIEAAKKDAGTVESEVVEAWKAKSPDFKYRIEMVYKSLVEPKLNRSDVIWIAEMFPLVLMRLANTITKLTELGGDVKKNSQG